MDEESSSGGSSLEDEDEDPEDPELLLSGSSPPDSDGLLLSSASLCIEEITLSTELVPLVVCCDAARDFAPGVLTHLGYRSALVGPLKASGGVECRNLGASAKREKQYTAKVQGSRAD